MNNKETFKTAYQSLRSNCVVIENRELYVVYDEDKNQLYAGGATNCFVFREFEHDIDYDFSFDQNLQEFIEQITYKIMDNTKLIEGFEVRAFSGFYCTVWSEDVTLGEINDYNECVDAWRRITSWDEVEYRNDEYQSEWLQRIPSKFAQAFDEIFGGDIEFRNCSLDSPTYYNYSNDKLVVDMFIGDYDAFLDKVGEYVSLYKEELTKAVREDWSTRDGFWSFVENDFDKWNWEEDSTQLEILLGYLITFVRESESKLERLETDIYLDGEMNEVAYWREICPFRIGDKVKWNDPAIEDFDESDREEMLNRIFTVDKIGYSAIDISDGHSEAEVMADELELIEGIEEIC